MKNKLKSNSGFTLQDLLIACFFIIIFIGTISTMMYKVNKTNIKANLTAQMIIYSVQILENIDKISYEDVETKTVDEYREEFSIPDGFDIKLEISNYGGNTQNQNDVIKIVKLTLSYTFANETEEYTIKRLKIREI